MIGTVRVVIVVHLERLIMLRQGNVIVDLVMIVILKRMQID